MRRKVVFLICMVVIFATAGVVLSQSSANYRLDRFVIAGGGGSSSSAAYGVKGTVGQALAHDASASSSYRVEGGFWPFPGPGDRYLQTMYRLGTGPETLTISGPVGWHEFGSQVLTQAAPGSFTLGGVTYSFSSWYVDGVAVGGNPIVVTMTENRTAVALYLPN